MMNNESTGFKQTILNLISEKNGGALPNTSDIMKAYKAGETD